LQLVKEISSISNKFLAIIIYEKSNCFACSSISGAGIFLKEIKQGQLLYFLAQRSLALQPT
jgi:hypothetical protein